AGGLVGSASLHRHRRAVLVPVGLLPVPVRVRAVCALPGLRASGRGRGRAGVQRAPAAAVLVLLPEPPGLLSLRRPVPGRLDAGSPAVDSAASRGGARRSPLLAPAARSRG